VQEMEDNLLFAVVLAAGTASRYGSTKQLAKYAGQALVARAVRTAESHCGARTVLVVGNDHHAVTAACQPLQGFFVYNPNFAEGIASSIRSGVRCIASQADGILLLLADQPLIDQNHLGSLETAWRAAPDFIVASAYAGTVGPPAIFPKRDFESLASLEGDRGAKTLLESSGGRLKTLSFERGSVDVDEPEDLTRLRN